jgi:hypothetical protein
MQSQEWITIHDDGHSTVIRLTEEAIFEVYVVEPYQQRRLVGAGPDRAWADQVLAVALLDRGHQCSDGCGPEFHRPAPAVSAAPD